MITNSYLELNDYKNAFNYNKISQNLKDSVVNEGFNNLSKVDKEKQIRKYRTEMEKAAKSLDFIEAARIRDIIKLLKK